MRLGPRIDGAFVERERLVGNHAVHVVIDGVAEALAARAGAGGQLKLNRIGSGAAEFHAAGLALELLVEAQALGCAGGALEDDFAGFAVADFDGIDQALVEVGRDRDAVHQDEDGLREIDIEQRFGRGEFEDAGRPETGG